MTLKTVIVPCIFVALFTYLGVATRLALTLVSELAHGSLLPALGSGFFLANILGSFIMGVAGPLLDHFRYRTYWHVGITSGFCGSCTTFSTWQRVTADLMLSGQIVDSLVMSAVTFCTSYMALVLGRHFGNSISTCLNNRSPRIHDVEQSGSREPRRSSLFSDAILGITLIFVFNVALWVGIFVDPVLQTSQWWVAMALAPAGSLTRYLLSLYNKHFPKFPLFTFLINVIASLIAMIILVVQGFLTGSRLQGSYEFWVVCGIGIGILGSLSTVSTFVNELYKFSSMNKLGLAYRYGIASIVVSQILCIAVDCAKFAHGAQNMSGLANATALFNASL